ncbi:MAG: threonylcarbamoyl-AMP synthase [Elusimicrobia bacterium GWF2_52_66]|nr:MAG: threonylcarbamoyl-AMP synthase [Elusimicrobia bacterium GWA2_51_34]OGR86586.1 MAG: threonylcarbamoyl-AMP synthase [Elusimicrobia bacterium GWF2_52_66]HAF95577.1 threonylcarbamoyl-AMP synthase [Elusimicrobiota bacterium]HCE97678.1 threonylcarbamoyl-AMP synthase [Elusimicrobiota bacterium]
MKIVKATPVNIKKAAASIRRGGVVAFPTETVYGLGADGFNPEACARIFEIKKRPRFDPLILHAASLGQAKKLFSKIPKPALKLMKKFWPGPLTLVLAKTKAVPGIVTAGLDTVAVRVPAHPMALKLIKLSGRPIAAPSANLFGRLSPTTARHVKNQLGNGPDIILDGGKAGVGVESTIIAFIGAKPVLLRPGGLAVEKIEKIVGKLFTPARGAKKPIAPGGLKKHYSPAVKLKLVNNESSARPGPRSAYLAFSKLPPGKYKKTELLSAKGDLREAAANLFKCLHSLERKGVGVIYAERVPRHGLGLAIMDRLKRGAQH